MLIVAVRDRNESQRHVAVRRERQAFWWWPLGALVVLHLLWPTSPRAENEVVLHMGYYEDDERLSVLTPSISAEVDLQESTTLRAQYTYETFDREPPEGVLDAVTGATSVSGGVAGGAEDTRHAVAVGGTQRFNLTALTAGYYFAREQDFLSHAFSLGMSQELFRRNLTLSAVYRYTDDDIDNLTSRPDEVFPRTKATHTFTMMATQLLSPKMWILGGYSYGRISGYQSLPQRKVLIPFTIAGITISEIFDETHPDERHRHTIFLRSKRYFLSRTVADVNLFGYFDDWGIHAFSTELRLSQYLTDDLVVRLRYRFYTQSEASFYEDVYTQPQTYLTADDRLRAFDTHTAGIKLTYNLRSLGLEDWWVSVDYDRYQETNNGLAAHILQGSFRIAF